MSFRHMDPSRSLKSYTKDKSERLSKYFGGRIHVAWTFTDEKLNKTVHCHLTGGYMDYFGEVSTTDFLASVDIVYEKIEKQLKKHKSIVKDHLHRKGRIPRGRMAVA